MAFGASESMTLSELLRYYLILFALIEAFLDPEMKIYPVLHIHILDILLHSSVISFIRDSGFRTKLQLAIPLSF